MARECINIAFSCNNNWVDKLAVTLVSILKHSNVMDNYKFFVLDGGITQENKQKLAKIKSKTKFEIEYLKVNREIFSNVPLNNFFTIETYFRLKLPTLVNVDKLLYLDVDIAIRKNISNLYNTELKNYYAAAVIDESSYYKKLHKLSVNRYFNAGVLLLNLKKIREDNLEEKFFDFIKYNSDKICWVDQCVLNAVFNENVKFLGRIYNFQHSDFLPDTDKKYKELKNDVVIIHFVTVRKPWNFEKSLNFVLEYYYYYFQTPFRFDFFKHFIIKMQHKIRLMVMLLSY